MLNIALSSADSERLSGAIERMEIPENMIEQAIEAELAEMQDAASPHSLQTHGAWGLIWIP